LIASRDSAINSSASILASIVKGYQTARAEKLKAAKESCANGAAFNACVQSVCETNMINKCAGDGFESEKSMATLLCKFHNTACSRLK
jgi:hypothetical protein